MWMDDPSRKFNLNILLLLSFNFLPHFSEHAWVILFFSFPCLAWRLAYEYQKVGLPNKIIKFLLVSVGVASLYFFYGEYRSVEATTAALLIFTSFKMLDNVHYRDAMVILFVNFMVLMTAFLFQQSLAMTLFGFLDVILITSLLFQLHKGKSLQLNFWYMIRLGLKMSLSILPLMILLFVVFPRFSTGLLANSTPRAESGFSDRLEPGGIEKLALDNSTAFRVRFRKQSPRTRDLYWRGAVFSKTQGLKWGAEKGVKDVGRTNRNLPREGLIYELTLEPQYGKWLFFLEEKTGVAFKNWRVYRNIVEDMYGVQQFKKPLGQNFRYTASASLQSKSEVSLFPEERERYLQTRESDSKELLDFVDSLDVNTAESLESLLLNFYQKNFRYSLDLTGKVSNSLDEFLFENKVGFCEHFAASFAYIARLKNIPSRVVVGFQGGVKNPLSDFYKVSNRDAHAWAEIYSESQKRWVRVDPTTVVAPQRILLGGQIYHSISGDQRSQYQNAEQYYNNLDSQGLLGLLERTKLYFDMVENNWNNFLLTYDYQKQKELLEELGIDLKKRGSLFLISILLLIAFFLIYRFYQIRRTSFRLGDVDKRWGQFKKLVNKRGIVKQKEEGPLVFMERVANLLPELKVEIFDFGEEYLNLKYRLDSKKKSEKLESSFKEIQRKLKKKSLEN